MHTTETAELPVPPAEVYPLIVDLERYPEWLPLVAWAERTADDADAWIVELTARVGPFARSKQLRMRRTETIPDRLAVFEREETDGRDHARWALRAEVTARGDGASLLVMDLRYEGALWTGAVLGRVLDAEVRRGRELLTERFSGLPTP